MLSSLQPAFGLWGDREVRGGIDCLACISLCADSLLRRAFSRWLSENLTDLKFPFCLCRSLPAVLGETLSVFFFFFRVCPLSPHRERLTAAPTK